MHSRLSAFTYSACGPFTKNKERIRKIKERRDSKCIYQIIAYGDSDLTRRTAADKVLCNKTFNIAKNRNNNGYQHGPASMAYKSFNKKASDNAVKNDTQNEELSTELNKPIVKKFEKRKVHSASLDTIWGADFANTQLISKFNKAFWCLLCIIDIYSKYMQGLFLWKINKSITITNTFQKNLHKSNSTRNKIWVDKGSEFWNRSAKSWLQNNGIDVYSMHTEGKCIFAENVISKFNGEIVEKQIQTNLELQK